MGVLKINNAMPKDENADINELARREMRIDDLLIFTTEHNCSDLYIKVGEHPYISRFGKIVKVPCYPTSKDIWATFYDQYILNELNADYVRQKLLDTSVAVRVPEESPNYGKYPNNQYRYRVSFGFSEEKNVATFRMIKPEHITFENINYNPKCVNALKIAYSKPSGITFFTGPTGSGKALEQHTKIPTVQGMKLLKDIKVGDTVFDKNSNPTKVTGKYHPNDEKFYEFTFSDGTKVKSAEGHLWEVELLNVWNNTPYTELYNKIFDSDILYKLEANKTNHMRLDLNAVYHLIFNEKCTYKQLVELIDKFNDIKIDIRNYKYIDLDLLIKNCTNLDRCKRLQEYRKNTQYISNNEAKILLKSKFIQHIRAAGIEYIPTNKVYVYLDVLCNTFINYYYDVADKITKIGHNVKAILTTHDIVANGLKNNVNRLNFAILRPKMCEFNIDYNLPIKPYSFGFWLGDGRKCDFIVNKMYKEPMLKIQEEYPEAILTEGTYDSDTPSYTIDIRKTITRKVLRDNSLYENKHIPNCYKYMSIQDRLLFIAGLIDSDGSIDENGCCTIGLTIPSIIYDLREICCSLGFKCSKIKHKLGTYSGKSCKEFYSFNFYPTVMLPLQVIHKKTNLENKLNSNKSQQIKHERFYLTDIKEISGSNNEYYCLSVDSNTHTFLCTESYLPTHNSTTMAACINTFTQPNGILDNKVFITLEDPIENMFECTDSVKISQKELGKDFMSFDLGIKASLREHPNCILVGEARDKTVICATIEAARTGHSTTATFHASDVAGTVNRLLYHLDNDKNLSLDLILQFNLILSQKMLKQNGKYLVDTQFMVFEDIITSRLVDVLDRPDANISKEINQMILDPYLQQQGLVKDWDYKHLH